MASLFSRYHLPDQGQERTAALWDSREHVSFPGGVSGKPLALLLGSLGWGISPHKSSGLRKERWVGSQPQLGDPELGGREGHSCLKATLGSWGLLVGNSFPVALSPPRAVDIWTQRAHTQQALEEANSPSPYEGSREGSKTPSEMISCKNS